MAPRIAVVGGVSSDTIVGVDALPDGGAATACAVHVGPGGKARNQAMAGARAGAAVAIVGQVGDDEAGRDAICDLASAGVDVAHLHAHEAEATGRYVSFAARGGRWSGAWLPGANAALRASHVADAREVLASAALVLVQMEVPDEAVAAVLHHSGGHVVLDVGPAPDRADRFVGGAWMVRANSTEAEALTGVEVSDEAAARKVAALLLERGPRWASVSAGGAGELLACDGGAWWVPAPPLDVVDTTGAGDALLPLTVVLLARGAPPREAARAGAEAAWRVTQHLGADSCAAAP